MEFDVSGEGEPLVLVHGALTDKRMWHAIHPALATQYRVFRITQRYFSGAGASGGDTPPFGYETHARDLVRFIRDVVGQPALVVGWSYGADVVLLAAKLEPSVFRAVFLYEPGRHTHLAGSSLDAYFADAGRMFSPLLSTRAREGILRAAEELIDASAAQEGYFARQSAHDQRIQRENAFTLPLQLQQAPSLEVSCTDIKALSMPLCFARGALTRPLFQVATDEAHACASHASHRIVEGATHMLPLDAPDRFGELVRDYFDSVDGF